MKIISSIIDAIFGIARKLRHRKVVDSFLVKLAAFGELPVLVTVSNDGKIKFEFDPGVHDVAEVQAELERIVKL